MIARMMKTIAQKIRMAMMLFTVPRDFPFRKNNRPGGRD
jgi:hypothetical protein